MLRWLFEGPTVAQRMADAQGRASGFDYLRLILATVILISHSFEVTNSKEMMAFTHSGPGLVIRQILVPMFFGLGGFLVAGSLDRTRSLVTYLGLRVLRIFPALWADILFAALLLGPLVTTVTLGEYVASREFHSYFLNLIGEIHYKLPGVFKGNALDRVNGQLWTVPWDLAGYMLLSLFSLAGFYGKRRTFLIVTIVMWALFLAGRYVFVPFEGGYTADMRFTVVPCFLAGVLFHLYRDRIVWSHRLFALSATTITVCLLLTTRTMWLLVVPILYVTVYFGLFNPRRVWIIASGDYSYGVFLYHWQFEQALWFFVPVAATWYGNVAIALPLTFFFAFLSWHLVEKHALALRHPLMACDDWFAERFPITRTKKPPVALEVGSSAAGR